jgi:hypothetical protein
MPKQAKNRTKTEQINIIQPRTNMKITIETASNGFIVTVTESTSTDSTIHLFKSHLQMARFVKDTTKLVKSV